MDAGRQPEGVRLTRREVLRRALVGGAGVLAASTVGCGAGASALTAASSSMVATPEPSTATPTLPPLVTPSPTPTPPPELRLNLVTPRLVLPRIGLDTAVEVASMVRGADGKPEIVVPERGVVTPNRSLGRNGVNNIWLLGHSRWRGVPQALHPLGHLSVGDEVVIDATEAGRGREFTHLEYRVTRCVLTDREAGARVVYAPRLRPRVVIQTSVRQDYSTDWILDRRLLESKVEVVLDGAPDDPSKYLLLMVVAELTDRDAERAARIAVAPPPSA